MRPAEFTLRPGDLTLRPGFAFASRVCISRPATVTLRPADLTLRPGCQILRLMYLTSRPGLLILRLATLRLLLDAIHFASDISRLAGRAQKLLLVCV